MRITSVRTPFLATVVMVALAGCSETEGDELPSLGRAQSFDVLFGEAARLGSAVSTSDGLRPFTDPSDLPTSGSAVYEGVMALGADTFGETVVPEALLGEMAMRVDFDGGDDAITGRAGNFVTPGDRRYEGELDISGGSIDRDVNPNGGGWTYEAGIEGTLTRGDNELDIEGDFVGDFRGGRHGFAEGYVEDARVRGSDGTAFDIDGAFLAER